MCPPLEQFAATVAGTRDIAVWTMPGYAPPRSARNIVAQWPGLDRCPDAPVVVMLTPVDGQQPSGLAATMAGRTIVEAMLVPQPALLGRLRASRTRSRAVFAAVERFASWREAGLLGAEQWVTVAPCDAVITAGTCPARVRSS